MKSFNSKRWGKVLIEESYYAQGNRMALLLIHNDGCRLATLTTNMPEHDLEEGEFFVKDWSENQELAAEAMASGLFVDTGKRVGSGHVPVPVWKFKQERVLHTNEIAATFTEVLKSEWGGADPRVPGPITLQARWKEKSIEVFVVGKWRDAYYYPQKRIPSGKILNIIRQKLITNTGGAKSPLGNREIVFQWPADMTTERR